MIETICSLPTYMLNKLEDATKCGAAQGVIAAIIATVFVLIFFVAVIGSINKSERQKKRENPEYKTKITVYLIPLVIFILILLFCWTVIPFLVVTAKEMAFKENELIIDNLVKGGMSREVARTQVIQQRQLEEKIEAQRDAARIQARATDRQTDALTRALERK